MTQENLNNLENNETPKTTPEKVEQQEISQEEFLNWLDNEGNSFKQETQTELDKANSVDLDQPTFEKIKNETGVEDDLNAIDKEAEKYIDEARQLVKESESLQKNPEYSSFEGIDLMDDGQDQRKKLEEMIASGQISPQEVAQIKQELQAEQLAKQTAEDTKEKERYEKDVADLKDLLQEYSLKVGDVLKGNRGLGERIITRITDDRIYFRPQTSLLEDDFSPRDIIQNFELSVVPDVKENMEKSHETKNENNLENQIQNASNSAELYGVLMKAGGIQGSEEYFRADRMIDILVDYFNDKVDATDITRTGGLREKAKQIKLQTRQELNAREASLEENKKTPETYPGSNDNSSQKESLVYINKHPEIPDNIKNLHYTRDMNTGDLKDWMSKTPEQQKRVLDSLEFEKDSSEEKTVENFENNTAEEPRIQEEVSAAPDFETNTQEQKQPVNAEYNETLLLGKKLSDFPKATQERYKASVEKYSNGLNSGMQEKDENGLTLVDKAKNTIRKDYDVVMNKLGVLSSGTGASDNWIYWDLGKQSYLSEHPEESNENYNLANPFNAENQEITKDIVNRHVGWEILNYVKTSPEFLNGLDKNKDSYSKITSLINEWAQANKLSSYKLSELGKLVQENKGI